ncbi:septum site-determining protein Ssd [Streptomyces albireticuli]|uniref:Septum formation initiator n=1 Tax=Streptomyces albireticuli TaxID=1940 RepID=A0A2A2D1P7_9ACTN|nr:septum site-determining protein Ssd [Streptomyces albireticuli]MCD9145198.1 septum formation initiator [Streptomyces albireticuli]MCD9164627.1 septum formation initiator [Streptomyces albireticuli]MCD9194892.1 septum formation initiator [Streptomyces albireticuli]PAU45435.1 septum formation initiator [Streptomyces albireticuli]
MAGSSSSEWPPKTGARGGGPLIVTEDEGLLDDLLRLCAAAGALPEVAHGTLPRPAAGTGEGAGGSAERRGGAAAPLTLIGDDCAHRFAATGLGSLGEHAVLVGRDPDDAGIWRRAVEIGARGVAVLPEDEGRLVDRIADAVEGATGPARTVGVIGGRGGAGASTLACALALAAARAGRRTMLVDADPLGGGLDVLLGGERADGLRWPAFADSRGRVAGQALEESLPELHALRLLSWDRGDCGSVPPDAMRAVLAAARRRSGVVVVDLPRRLDPAALEALGQLDTGLLVVPAELRAVAAAHRVVATVGQALGDLRVVVRGPCGSGLDGAEIARLLGLPLAGELAPETGLPAALAAGRPPGAGDRGPLSRFCAEFWDQTPDRGEEASV